MPDGEEADQVRAGFHRHLENLNRAVWHELGTSRIPPRPFLAPALYQNEALIKKPVGEVVRDYLAAGRMDFDFLSAALHAVDQGYDIGVNVAPDFFQLDYLLVARHAGGELFMQARASLARTWRSCRRRRWISDGNRLVWWRSLVTILTVARMVAGSNSSGSVRLWEMSASAPRIGPAS